MISPTVMVSISIVLVAAAIIVYIVKKTLSDKKISSAESVASKKIEHANREVLSILKTANQEAQQILSKARKEGDSEIKARRQSIADIENRVIQKEKHLEQRENVLNDKRHFIEKEEEKLKALRKKETDLIVELSSRLEKIAGFTKEEAEKIIMENTEKEMRKKAGKMIKDMESHAKKIANRRAQEIITDAIQRTAVDHVTALTTSTVQLPNEDLKGRVIGKEGRNIRAFEAETGVDVIIDDTPGAVILSAFDPIRREIAKMAMTKLLKDGRIHPTKIEEAVELSRKELHDIIIERGEKAADEVGLQFHPKIIEMLGKLHYRTSYGQNILQHSLESAHIAGIMANTLGVNATLSKRGALLHDIGKAIDFEQEGSHTDLGKEICEKYDESAEVINCIMAHHEDEAPDTIEAILVMMADAMSSVRPGARRESIDSYIKRLEKLELLANSFDGVEKAYAIQAGREVRVVVRPDEIDDAASQKLAFDMAKQIEKELIYPGEVKVSVVRETRAFGLAK